MMKTIALLLLLFSAHVMADIQVHVFVDGPLKVAQYKGVNITVYDMTEADRLTSQTPTFSRNRQVANKQVAVWLKSKEGKLFLQKVNNAHQGTKALSDFKVKKIPAIVIDGTYVTYGSTDVKKAVNQYLAAKNKDAQQ